MTDNKVTEMKSFNVKDARKEAEKEINDEKIKTAKVKLKAKLKALADAEQIVANLKRELAELEHELENGIG